MKEPGQRAIRWRQPGLRVAGLRVAGAGLLIATAAIHLDLYLTGYRSIPTIGWLFLLQVIAAFGLGVTVLAVSSRLAAAAGAGFSLATLGGYLLSVWIGLFGFKEVRTTAGIVAGAIEVAGFVALAALALAPANAASAAAPSSRATTRKAGPATAVTSLAVLALALLGIAAATAGGQGTQAAGGGLRTAKINNATVLTNTRGFTLYWFAPDTSTASKCYGSCAAYWPPVLGSPTADPGVTGRLGTIKRSDGSLQVTYNGHPLYTYVGDGAPGQARGNNLNLNGGLWHEVTVSGTGAAA